jgi:hypothetical protein
MRGKVDGSDCAGGQLSPHIQPDERRRRQRAAPARHDQRVRRARRLAEFSDIGVSGANPIEAGPGFAALHRYMQVAAMAESPHAGPGRQLDATSTQGRMSDDHLKGTRNSTNLRGGTDD